MTNTLIIKHWRLAALVLGIIAIFGVLYLLRTVVFPFAIGMVIAYLLMPVVTWLERKLPRRGHWTAKRIFSILIIFTLLTGLIGFFSYYIMTVVIDASLTLLDSAPYFISQSLSQVQEWFEVVRQQFPDEIRLQIDKAFIDAGIALGNTIRDAFVQGVSFVPRNFSAFLGFAALPFFLFYLLKDSERLSSGFYSMFTPGIVEHVRNVILIIERVLGQYIRAQIMLGLIVAYFAFLGLLLLRIPFAPALALLAGITELIPTLGPWIGGGVAVIVTLAIAPGKAIWVAILYLTIQLVENYFLVPRIQSAYLRIHPVVIIVLIVSGSYIAGFWGLILAAPLAATLIEIYKYVHRYYTEMAAQQTE